MWADPTRPLPWRRSAESESPVRLRLRSPSACPLDFRNKGIRFLIYSNRIHKGGVQDEVVL